MRSRKIINLNRLQLPVILILSLFTFTSLAQNNQSVTTGSSTPELRKLYDSNSPFTSLTATPKEDSDRSESIKNNLWMRVKSGFVFPETKGKFVRRYETWFLNNPDYLERVFQRCKIYLYYVVNEIEKRKMPMEIALLPIIESGYNPYAYSRAHAAGIWQFIPSTGHKFGIKQNWWVDERRDVVVATNAALNYLEILHKEFQDWKLALAAYNCGENCVRRAIFKNKKRGKTTNYEALRLPRETRRYIPKLQAIKNIILNPKKMGYELSPIVDRPYFTKVPLEKEIDVVLAANLATLSIEDFLQLNPSYHRPVMIAESHRPVLIPIQHRNKFTEALDALKTPRLSWTIYSLSKPESVKALSKKFNLSSARLLKFNGLHPTRRLEAKTMILVPLQKTTDKSNLGEMWSHQIFTQKASFFRAKIYHRVRRGDTLTKISRRYNVSIKSLKRWNKIKGTLIKKGQRLIVYGNPTVHRVVAGDTLSAISRRYGISISKIKRWNRLNGNLIKVGQKILLHKKSKAPLLKDLLI